MPIGPKRAGKSSIVEAIWWDLYGNRVARSGKDEIRSIQQHGWQGMAVLIGGRVE